MTETFECKTPGVCVKKLLLIAQSEALRGSRATKLELGLHRGGDPDVLNQLQAEVRTFNRVQRTCLRSALSGGRCLGGGGCGAVFEI